MVNLQMRVVAILLFITSSQIVLNVAQPVVDIDNKEQDSNNSIEVTTLEPKTTNPPKGAACSHCKDKCKTVKIKMLDDNVTCELNDGCSCECCGEDFKCQPGHFFDNYCQKSNGPPAAK